ncbi:hypothetical protein [Methylomonas albis]|nr:hypothetical protein [Methylomonas albis]
MVVDLLYSSYRAALPAGLYRQYRQTPALVLSAGFSPLPISIFSD